MSLLDRICEHEGFEPKPYPDPLSGGEPYTFGHGLTFITEEESKEIVRGRIVKLQSEIMDGFPWVTSQPVIEVMIEMAYQMGVRGLSNFTNFLAACKRGDYQTAADEMLDSRWAVQTPSRARELADIVRAQ